MCELIKFTRNFEWFVLCSRLGESSLQKYCCWYSNSPTTVTNNSLSEDYSHPAITQDKQLLPLGSNHLPNFELSAGSSLRDNFWAQEKRDQNCCALKTLVRSPNVK